MLASGVGAAVLYGAWGYWANHPFGGDAAGRAAAVQAVWSFAFTFVLAGVVEVSARRCERAALPALVAALPPLFLVWVGPVAVHALNGTPALVQTVAPGVLIGTAFVAAYLTGVSRRTASAKPPNLLREVVDIGALRRTGSAAEKEALARRIFTVWQPLFSHLDDHDYTFHLRRHVEDESAVQIRAVFGVDLEEGDDDALIIVRVHEHDIRGRVWARLTVNAGVEAPLVKNQFGQAFLALEIWRYRVRHPFRPFFIVDSVISEASYCAYAKTFSGFAPTAVRPVSEAWWPLGVAGARALGGEPIPGARREVMRFPGRVREVQAPAGVSRRSEEAARFYRELTGAQEGAGLLVMAPLSFFRCAASSARFLWASALRPLRSRRGRSR
jgi:hypothetical protein